MSSQTVARDAFMKTIGNVAAEKAMAPVIKMATDTLGAYFGQRSEGPLGPTPRDIKDEKTGEVIGRESTGLGGATRDYLYSLLTERGKASSTKQGAEAQALNSAKYGRKRPTEPSISQDSETGKYSYYPQYTKNSDNPFLQNLFDNAETVANLGGYAAPIAGAAAAGLGLHFATKPRSDYAVGLEGLGPSTGNSNIDAARASAHYQQETAQMKFEHQMALQQARAEAQTPGRQAYGKAVGAGRTNMGGDAYDMATSLISATTPIYK